MIDRLEFQKFATLPQPTFNLFNDVIVKLANGNEVLVRWREMNYLDYFFHPRFGVVRQLRGNVIDKSPLCYELDAALEEILC